ncbi:MAG: glucosamine--fructose-6-phosphate aminotransferase, partial [Nocardioidaceae bacterium]|nr:glucosamine--fructose-6-phosphate aminotransferase [Nocardioidaceae bacterium]
VSDRPHDDATPVVLPPAAVVADWLSPVTAVVPGQLLAWRAAELRGVDVDHPGDLSKVTLTR